MSNALRREPFASRLVLVTGGTGYVGSLIVASLLRDRTVRLVCPVRGSHERASALAGIIGGRRRWTVST